ncbi:MAG: DUF2887 domain-containing protein [Deltaproteobacteria bacterium]|nr:DUF2887 domain-containing protein [Deltaproteobacteria bacterium]
MKISSMEKSGNRGSDETFYRLMQTSGDAVLRLLGVTSGYPYKVQAETLKAKNVSPDIVAIPATRRGDLVFLEFQGYRDPFIRHRLAETALLYCRQKNYRGPYILAIIYTEQAWFKAALPLKAVNSAGHLTFQGWPHEIILENLQEEALLAADLRLAVLAPYTVPKNISEDNLAIKARAWGNLVRQVYPEEHSTEILDLLIMFLMNRFRKITRKGFRAMLNFDLTDTVAGRQVFRSGIRKGRVMETRKKIQDLLVGRFGLVPEDILSKIERIESGKILDALFQAAIKTSDIETFRSNLP